MILSESFEFSTNLIAREDAKIRNGAKTFAALRISWRLCARINVKEALKKFRSPFHQLFPKIMFCGNR